MCAKIIEGCSTTFCIDRAVAKVASRGSGIVTVTDTTGKSETFDKVIFACDAETTLKVLENPTYWEEKALRNVRYFSDMIITHEDEEYMKKHYEMKQRKRSILYTYRSK